MKWRIRFIELFELLTLVAGGWSWLRHVLFPDGITGGELLIVFLLLIVWEEIMRTRQEAMEAREEKKRVTITNY